MVEEIFSFSKRFPKLLSLAILFIAFIAIYAYTFEARIALLGDNASYYILGKALFGGKGYVDLSAVTHSPNNHYPPGYPAIISLIMLFDDSIVLLKLVNGLFFLLSLWILFELNLRLTNRRAFAFVVTFLSLLNAHLLYYASVILSEIPFLLFSSLSLLAFLKVDFNKTFLKNPYLYASLISFIISFYIRSLGLALLLGYVLYFLVHRRWKGMAMYSTAFVAATLPWLIRGQKLGGSSYVKQLMMVDPYQPELGQASLLDFAERFLNNFARYIGREIPSAIFPFIKAEYSSPLKSAEWITGVLLFFLFLYGIYSLPKYRWLVAGYLLGTLGILLLWPDVWIGVRFLVPLIPFLTLGFFYGCYAFLQKSMSLIYTTQAIKRIQPIWLLLFALLYLNPIYSLHQKTKTAYAAAWNSYFEVAHWLKKNEAQKVLVSTSKPSLFYIFSNTYSMRYKFADEPAEIIAELEEKQVDYVVIDEVHKNTSRYLLPATQKYPQRFKEVYRVKNTDTYLLKFVK